MAMQFKNLAIGLLAISNLICLFIIVGQKTTFTPGTYDNEMLPSLKERLMKDYNVSNATCGAAVGLSKINNFAGSARLEMACLLQGSKKIVWGSLQELKNELLSEYSYFEQLVKAENIQEIDGVLYRPEGKRSALLFIKQKLLYEQDDAKSSDFLQGYLLGYSEKDIEFFYQRGAFRIYIKENNKIQSDSYIPFSYDEFSSDLKKQFNSYLKQEWPRSKYHMGYELDKKNTAKFLEENKNFSDEQLYQQIKELKKKS